MNNCNIINEKEENCRSYLVVYFYFYPAVADQAAVWRSVWTGWLRNVNIRADYISPQRVVLQLLQMVKCCPSHENEGKSWKICRLFSSIVVFQCLTSLSKLLLFVLMLKREINFQLLRKDNYFINTCIILTLSQQE